MKILAIRGRNLASLAGDFAIDFTTEPLASAGLFAITGATGSGKSTLLDALCLALYDNTPRLTGVGRGNIPDVAGETLSVADARALLRRGTGEGHAEVDFVGVDGVAYRARWTARRARSKGQGKMQFATLALTRLHDKQELGGSNKTDVLAATEAKVGLKFAQFTRAVLLAQNEFAAFLKSDDSERAELLEMLTGTERFSRISTRIYVRSKEESECLTRLHDRLAGQIPLADELRGALDNDLALATRTSEELTTRHALLQSYQRWYQALDQALAAEREAQANVNNAIRIRDEAATRRATFQDIERIQPARPLVEDCRRLAGERGAAAIAEQQTRDAHTIAVGHRQRAEETLNQSRTVATLAEQARQAAAPQLATARALSAQIDTLRPTHATAVQVLADANSAADQAAKTLTAQQKALADTGTAQQAATTWLAAHTGHQRLAEQWPRWDALLRQGMQTAAEMAQIDATLPGLSGTVSEAVSRQTQAVATQAALDIDLKQREATLAAAATDLGHFDSAATTLRRKALEDRRDQLSTITEVWRRLSQLGQQQSDLTGKLKVTHAETDKQTKRLAQANADRPAAELTLANATKAFQLAQTAASESVEHLRATLDTGTPCPVCGSTEHPYAESDPGLRAALAALDASVVAAAKQLDALKHAITAADTALAGLARTTVEFERELATLADKINAATNDWQGCALSVEAPMDPGEREPWLEQMAEALKASTQALAGEEQTIHAAMKQRDNAQLAVDAARREVAAAQHRVTETTQAVLAARTAADASTSKQNALSAQRDNLLDQLDAAFVGVGWRADWATDPVVFHSTAATEASQWLERDTQAKALATTSSSLATEVSHLAELRDTAVRRQHESKIRFDEIQHDLTGKTTALAELFGGRSADEVDAELNASVLQAQTILAAATESANQAGLALASAATSHTQASERYKSGSAAVEKAEATLADWMIQRNAADRTQSVERATLESMLAFDAAWITGEREALQALDQGVGTATAVLKDRGEARQRHEVSRPTLEAPEAVTEQLALGQAEVKVAADHQAMLKAQQLQDDQRRLQAAALAGEISVQEARARTWAQLNDMIGSADGRKFRNLAQQMTLDVLLGYANRHLTSLARRYRLERISDTLGLMVIDQDMADEVRSVHSLSGGESFLVSLALALGLASLSSHRVKVESLFIDEGFGSLDADSLRVAMEALDGLQAMGRKVGVISHVQEMTERIGTQIRVERHAGGRSSVSVVN